MADLQHEDFGEKIGGARKDLWRDRGLNVNDLSEMNSREAEKFVKKDNVWKKPDYQAMIDRGTPLGVVYFIKKTRDSLPASPQYYRGDDTPEKRLARQLQYIETVRELQAVVEDIRTVDEAMRAYDRFLLDGGYVKEMDGWASGRHYAVTKKGQDNPVITNKLAQALRVRSASSFEREYSQQALKEQFGVPKEEKVPRGYEIRYNDGKHTYSSGDDWQSETYYVTKGYGILKTNFETREAALKWVQEYAKQRSASGKKRFIPKQLTDVKRDGPDYRSGRDATGQDYLDAFAFRGGEFGNWMTQNDRRASLNMGFDALKDLAAALRISDKDISYGGTLAIAFGARGSGKAVAHYEPERQVINLTKMRGAGSLAHEWWHGLDDYLGEKMGAKGPVSERPRAYPLMNKLIETIKYKPETPEQAAGRMERRDAQTRKNAEGWLDSMLSYSVRRAGDEAVADKYAQLKASFLAGESGSVNSLNTFKKEISGHVIPKSDRERLESYERILRSMSEPSQTPPEINRTETDYYRNSMRMGKECEKDGGYWESNVELTARAFACYVQDTLSYRSDYLCGHAECALATVFDKDGNASILKAYPEGEERKAINAVFDEIVADLKREQILTHTDRPSQLQTTTVPSPREASGATEQLALFGGEKPSVLGQLASVKSQSKPALPHETAKKAKEPEI